MKLTFISEQYGTTVEINFEATHIDQIQEMFDQFLRGSGFHVEDEDDVYTKQENSDTSEECVHERDVSLTLPMTPDDLLRQSEKEGWRWARECEAEVKRLQELQEYTLKLLKQRPENKPWVGLTDDEMRYIKNQWVFGEFSFDGYFYAIEAKLKEKNT